MTDDEQPLIPFKPDWTFRPGISLAEVLADQRLTPEEAAAVTGLPVEVILGIGRGTIAIDEVTAGALHTGLGVSAGFWLKHQADYEEAIARGAKDISRDYVIDYPWIGADKDRLSDLMAGENWVTGLLAERTIVPAAGEQAKEDQHRG